MTSQKRELPMTNGERAVATVVIRGLFALCAGFVVLLAVATFARPGPRPSHERTGPGLQTLVLGANPGLNRCAGPGAAYR